MPFADLAYKEVFLRVSQGSGMKGATNLLCSGYWKRPAGNRGWNHSLPWRTGFHLLGLASFFKGNLCIFESFRYTSNAKSLQKRFFRTVQWKMVFSGFQSYFTGMLWRYIALESLTVMNPSFPLEDTANCCKSRIWLLNHTVGPDKCKTIAYKLSCGLSEAKVPESIKA